MSYRCFFFFQAEDGIRDIGVTGVQTCALPIFAALVPRAEIEGEMGDSHVGLQARLMSQALRKLTGSISKSRCLVIFINQVRMKIGVMYGNPETTTGGNARSEEHTSELQSRQYLVCRLLLEKK